MNRRLEAAGVRISLRDDELLFSNGINLCLQVLQTVNLIFGFSALETLPGHIHQAI